MQSQVRILSSQPTIKLLILHKYFTFHGVEFRPCLRGFLRVGSESIDVETFFMEVFACFARDYLSAAIPWLTLSGANRRC